MSAIESSPTPAAVVPASTNKSRRFILLVLVPFLAGIAGLFFYWHGGRYVETDNAFIKAEKVPVSSEVSGTVIEVFVQDNQSVKAGQTLFRIDPAHLQIAVTEAQAKLAQAYSDISALKAGYHAKQAEIRLARTNYDYAVREQARLSSLAVTNFVSKAKQESLAHDSDISKQKIDLLENELKQIAAAGGGTEAPVEQHPAYLSALAELEQSQLNLAHATVFASQAGTISKPPKVGQFITAGSTAMALVVDGNLWVEANLTETDITYLKPGQAVAIEIDSYPDTHWQGEIESISPATGAEFSIIPAQNATGNWVKIAQRVTVRIRILPNPNAPLLRAGLSAFIKIDTGHRRRLLGVSL